MYLLMTCYHSNLELLHVRIALLCLSVSFLYPCTYNNYVYLSLSNCMIFSVIIPVKVPDFHNLYDQLFIFNWIHTKLSNIDILWKQLGKCQVLLSLKDCPGLFICSPIQTPRVCMYCAIFSSKYLHYHTAHLFVYTQCYSIRSNRKQQCLQHQLSQLHKTLSLQYKGWIQYVCEQPAVSCNGLMCLIILSCLNPQTC